MIYPDFCTFLWNKKAWTNPHSAHIPTARLSGINRQLLRCAFIRKEHPFLQMLRHINPRRILCAKVRVNSALFSSRTVTGYHDFHVKSRTFMCFFNHFQWQSPVRYLFLFCRNSVFYFLWGSVQNYCFSGKQQNGTFLSAGTGGINCPAFLINKKELFPTETLSSSVLRVYSVTTTCRYRYCSFYFIREQLY